WAIPSQRAPEGLSDAKSVELLLALDKVDLSNGKINEAIRHSQRSIDIARSTMQDWKRSCAAYDLARAYVLINDYPKAGASEKFAKAEASYIEAQEPFAAIGEQECAGHNTIQLGMMYWRANERGKAEALCKEARDVYVLIQSVRGVPHATLALGHLGDGAGPVHVYRLSEEYDKAEAMYNKAHAPLVRLRNNRFLSIVLLGLAGIREKQRWSTEAEQDLEDATVIFGELGWDNDLPECDAQIKSLHDLINSLVEKGEIRNLES
ncbi:hypothetical protein FRC01_003565, partial [Tulasnella sp. 417]